MELMNRFKIRFKIRIFFNSKERVIKNIMKISLCLRKDKDFNVVFLLSSSFETRSELRRRKNKT